LARSFEAQGWTETSTRLYGVLTEKGKYQPVVRASVGRLVDLRLKALVDFSEPLEAAQKEKIKSWLKP